MTVEAAKMALEGLEMGYRVLGAQLNEAMAECHIQNRVLCGKLQPGDSMKTARNMLISCLLELEPKRYAQGRIYGEWPWTLGYLSGFHVPGYPDRKLDPYKVTLGDYHECERAEITGLRSRKAWSPTDWKRWVIDPISIHHEAWVRFLSQQPVEQDAFITGRKQDIARALSISIRTLMKHLKNGTFKGADLGGQMVKIHRAHLPPDFSR